MKYSKVQIFSCRCPIIGSEKGLKLRTKADVTVQNARTESLYASLLVNRII